MDEYKEINQLKDLGESVVKNGDVSAELNDSAAKKGHVPSEPTNSLDEKSLKDEKGNLTQLGIETLIKARQSPVEHFTVDIGINKFKAYVRSLPGFTKKMVNEQVRSYKKKAWGEYRELVNYRGSFPTHFTI